ncbi:MAG: ATP-binding protein [Anaerolineales bacterium]
MTQPAHTGRSFGEWLAKIWYTIANNIRRQIIIPYLILTLVVGILGIYVVTQLVSQSLDERLDSYLGESGRALLNSWVRYESNDHQDTADRLVRTAGFIEAVENQDGEWLGQQIKSQLETLNPDMALVVTPQEEVLTYVVREGDGFAVRSFLGEVEYVWVLQEVLAAGDPAILPIHAIGKHPDGAYYYFTAAPVGREGELSGALLLGSRLSQMMSYFQSNVLAQITLYRENGQAIQTTFSLAIDTADHQELLEELSLSSEIAQHILNSEREVLFEDIDNQRIRGREYRLAYGPLTVGSKLLGIYSVALPRQFVQEAGRQNRNTYILIFGAGSLFVIVLGIVIALTITNPVQRLMRTSLAVTQGDLKQRTGIQRVDELGVLAQTFDRMTLSLEERTVALEEALYAQRETASRMRAILASIGDGVLLEDLDGNIIPMNEAARMMLDDMAEQFRYGPLRELSVVDQKNDPDEPPSPWLLESRRFRVADKVFVAHSAVVRMEGDGGGKERGSARGEKLGTVIVIRDVTAEVEAEKLKDAFVAHVSHELRTPLTSIKGYSDLLLATTKSVLDASQRTFLGKIVRQTGNMITMVNALLDFTEIEAGGRLTLLQQPTQISALIEDIAEEWGPKMEDMALNFKVEMPDQPYPQVNIDQKRMRWAIINLVRNAWQYTPAGGDVTIRVNDQRDRIIVMVEDTGIGIPEEAQRNLFTRFFRVMHQQDDDVRGLGLGLYVTKAIVEAHGGYIRVSSEVGQGSAFSITLPTIHATDLPSPQPETPDGDA